jgi:polysaccharide biosynthesis/export protein
MKARFSFIAILLFLLAASSFGQDGEAGGAAPKGYQIGPGDEITGRVLGEKDYDFVATVDEDGHIEVPFSDKPVLAKCRTERDLRLDIEALLARDLRNPRLSLQVTKRSKPVATVYGEVNLPGQIEMRRTARLVELIAYSGGVKEEAGGVVQVFRTQRPICTGATDGNNWIAEGGDATDVPSKTFSLANVRTGKDEANPIILPGDVIFVHKAPPIYITGEVQTPQGIYLKEGGLTLTEAIAKVGGVRREAKTKDIKIYRLKAGAKDREIIAANYDQIKKGTQKDVPLQPNDIIEVDRAKDSIAMSILKMAIGAGRAGITTLSQTGGMRVIY